MDTLKNKSVKIAAPATIANLVCGFDILGMAIQAPNDEMEIILKEEPGISLQHIDDYQLPTSVHENVAAVALQALLNEYPDKNIGFHIVINKMIKPGSGLGSSAASSAGAVVAANILLNNYFSKIDTVRFAMQGEQLASGAIHADNIAPCIYGGVTLIRSVNPLDIIKIDCPPLFITVLHPQIEIKTKEARNILPKEIALKQAVYQWGNIAGLIAGMQQSDYELMKRSLEDVIIEPVRSKLIPGYDQIKKKCKDIDILGGGISGSGPSVFMLSKDAAGSKQAAAIMKEVYDTIGIEYHLHNTSIHYEGVQIIELI
jgi:homoserine kinase